MHCAGGIEYRSRYPQLLGEGGLLEGWGREGEKEEGEEEEGKGGEEKKEAEGGGGGRRGGRSRAGEQDRLGSKQRCRCFPHLCALPNAVLCLESDEFQHQLISL